MADPATTSLGLAVDACECQRRKANQSHAYRFTDCDGTVEVQQAFKDDALTEALNPADGKVHPVKKVFTPVGVTFKGGGFYKNDSRGSSSSTTPSTPPSSTTTGDSSSSSDTNKAPAPAPAAPSAPAPATSSSSSAS
jgi:predicted nucleic acid-binding Zn ribbon protein